MATKATAATKKAAPVKKAAAPARSTTAKKSAPAPQKAAATTQAAPAKKDGPATKAAPAKKAAPATKASPARKAAPATKATPAKKAATATKAAPAKGAPAKAAPATRKVALRVREDESPWTAKELRDIRAEIEADVAHLRDEITVAEADLVGLMKDAGDGAGDDQADAGAKTFEREQEISLANNARDMLEQNLHALERLDLGTYGICESCGNPIGKLRLQAAPRATLCVTCKTKQERR
jgi:RNA polymerase-binding protein DksA